MNVTSPQRRISWSRPLTDYTKVQELVGGLLRGRKMQLAGKRRGLRYLNAGCGPNLRSNFLNLDYCWRPGLDLCWDLSLPLPLADRALDGVYSEHCLEHLHYETAVFALREFKRVIRPGGTVRIVVPDAQLVIELYGRHLKGEAVQFPYVPDPPPPGFTPLVAVNRVFRSHGHLFAYDSETMGEALRSAGFRDPRKVGFMSGTDSILLIDSESRAVESLYMEATA